MEKDTTYVALDDSKRRIAVGTRRPGAEQPELREIANDPRQIRRVFERLRRAGPVAAGYEAGYPATLSTVRSPRSVSPARSARRP